MTSFRVRHAQSQIGENEGPNELQRCSRIPRDCIPVHPIASSGPAMINSECCNYQFWWMLILETIPAQICPS